MKTHSPTPMVALSSPEPRRTALMFPVSELSDQEREQLIEKLGKDMERAQRLGQRDELVRLNDFRMLLIRSRSPAQCARMQAESDQRLAEEGCYFTEQGALERARLGGGRR